MTKTLIRSLILGSIAAAAISGAAFAQASSTQATTASGTIFQPIVLAKTSDLAFGTIVRPTTGSGTVTVSQTDGTRALTGSLATVGAGNTRAVYGVTGEGGQAYSVTVPATMTMTRSGGTETLTVTLTPTATTGTLSGTLGTTGTAALGVGGVITVASTTLSGAYTGTFNTVVAYN